MLEYLGGGQAQFAWRKVPPQGPLLWTEAAGVCGTDTRVFKGSLSVSTPRILGHEIVGQLDRWSEDDDIRVTAVGSADPSADRLIVAPAVVCDRCPGCAAGRRCLYRNHYGLDLPRDGLNGGMSPVVSILPGSRLFAVSRTVPLARLIMAEPMACVASAMRRGDLERKDIAGTQASVIGFGPLGVCAATLLRDHGAMPLVVEPKADRRALASKLGFATATIDQELTESVELSVECAGAPEAFALGLQSLKRGGTLLELGNYGVTGSTQIAPADICDRNLRIIGSSETEFKAFETAIEVICSTTVNLQAAVTSILQFDRIQAAAEVFEVPSIGKRMVLFK